MRIALPSLLCLALALGAGARAEETPRTVSDWAEAMSATGVKLEADASDRQKTGDMAAAQRLTLASAMIERAAEEFRSAEQAALTDPLRALPAPLPALAADALAAANAAASAAVERPAFIDEAQRTFNALIAALPIRTPHPVIYGMLSRDLDAADLPADLVVYGYRLTDPVLGAKPAALYDRREIPSRLVGDERMEITLPDDVRRTVGFAPSPCETRAGFALRIRDAYAQKKGVWPLTWHEEIVTNSDLYALPTPMLYAAKATLSVQAPAASTSAATFQQSSELAAADCEQTRTFEVSATLPPGARNVNCTGEWISLAGAAHTRSRCVVANGVARATGELTGGARICSPEHLCTCPNSAQGFLVVKGGYDIGDPGARAAAAPDPAPLAFAAGGVAETRLALAPGQRLRHVAIDVARRNCPRASDRIDLDFADDGASESQAASKTGAFRASLIGGVLRVGAAPNFAAEVGRTP